VNIKTRFRTPSPKVPAAIPVAKVQAVLTRRHREAAFGRLRDLMEHLNLIFEYELAADAAQMSNSPH
jgi:hypothetical protein